MPASALPGPQDISAAVTLEQPAEGGHVGFVNGPFPGRIDWLPQRVCQFFAENDVSYIGYKNTDGTSLALKGKILNSARSMDMRGYVFKNGAYTYTVLTQGDPVFEIKKNGKVIITEPIIE